MLWLTRFGIRAPHMYHGACEIDSECGNRLWPEKHALRQMARRVAGGHWTDP